MIFIPSKLPILDFLSLALQCLQAILVLVGFALVLWQISEQTKATRISAESLRTAAYLQLMDRSSELNRLVVEVDDLSDFYNAGHEAAASPDLWVALDKKERRHYIHLGQLLSLIERAFLLRSRGWIDQTDFIAYQHHLMELIGLPQFDRWWPVLRGYYRSDFANFADQYTEGHRHTSVVR